MNEHIRRAVDALESGASEVRHMSTGPTRHVRDRLRRTVEEVLDHLEADAASTPEEPDDIFSHLDRQSREIAEELRRVERLMKRRTGQE